MYVYAPLNKKQHPTFPEANKAVQAADKQDDARDTRPLMSCLMRVAESSHRIVGNIGTRRAALAAFDWELEPLPGIAQDDQRLIAAYLRLRRVIDEAISYHTDTPAYGVYCCELQWTYDGTVQVPSIGRRYLPVEIERGEGRTLWQVAQEGAVQRMPLDTETPGVLLWDVDEKFHRGGFLRTLLYPQLTAGIAWQEWTQFSQRLKGMIIARLEEWATDDDKKAAVESLRGMLANDFTVGSKAVNYEMMTPDSYLGATAYKDLITQIDDATSVVILGQSGTTQLPPNGGSRAALQVMQLVSADVFYTDMTRMEKMIQRQVVEADALTNLGNPIAPWRFRFKLEQEKNPESYARIIVDYLAANIPIRESEVYGLVGLTVPGENDKVLGAPAASENALLPIV